jgi:hypothetical protein
MGYFDRMRKDGKMNIMQINEILNEKAKNPPHRRDSSNPLQDK